MIVTKAPHYSLYIWTEVCISNEQLEIIPTGIYERRPHLKRFVS